MKNISFSNQNINNESFDLLKEYLQEECKISFEEVDNINGVKFTLKSKYNDKITIIRYNNGNTLFQGKPLYIFSEIKSFLIDILEIDDIINIQNEIYKVNVRVDDIKSELASILQNSHNYLCNSTKKMLSSCLTLKKVSIELDDYTAF